MRAGMKLGLWATALAALWGGAVWLRPLGELLPMTREMVVTTKAILAETRELQTGVDQVKTNVRELHRQEQLLSEQEKLTRVVLAELQHQEQLSLGATESLERILLEQGTTVELIRRASAASDVTLQGLSANARELDRLAEAAGRIHGTSWAMDRQLDRLLTELEGSAENFATVERLRQAVDQAADRSTGWWERLKEWWPWD